ncbi:hypothetical protein SAMN05660657_03528 [Geodermatophilus amargosae]|uniref:Uncharacterized protein n=1 Tax=Geodermatophilus amargosae TaxID=1296565 RepID=A0A1I7BDW7_9ACTN|nr:hypothetical protein [Geodermatophilus amargosae]SFT85357.1 hypothetical protein SAMN05660657_03528 [Geodermatophilus amargosae]
MAVRLGGRVVELLATRDTVNIVLDNDPAVGPKHNRFILRNSHQNYNALYSLALAAAANRWTLVIRIAGDAQIDPEQEAEVALLGVAWER